MGKKKVTRKEFNEFLENESTNTWWATNKRVDVSELDSEYLSSIKKGGSDES